MNKIERMLTMLGISAAEFSRQTGIPEAYISKWRFRGVKISEQNAKRIHERYPQFLVRWILDDDSDEEPSTFEKAESDLAGINEGIAELNKKLDLLIDAIRKL